MKKRVAALTTHTVEEAQKMVSYPIKQPSYVPKGYELESEDARTEEMNIGKDPVVEFQYRGDVYLNFKPGKPLLKASV
jgi:hypothetical protein